MLKCPISDSSIKLLNDFVLNSFPERLYRHPVLNNFAIMMFDRELCFDTQLAVTALSTASSALFPLSLRLAPVVLGCVFRACGN